MTKKRIFFITQNLVNPRTNEKLIDEKQIKEALNHKVFKKWAYILHNKDIYTEEDEKKDDKHKCDMPKNDHYHVALYCDDAIDPNIVAKWFNIPLNQIDFPKGGSNAFLDCVKYLTHESEKEQKKGKHLYSDDEVIANFNWREELEKYEGKKKVNQINVNEVFDKILYSGLTIKESINNYPEVYRNHYKKCEDLRSRYLLYAPLPPLRINIYIEGKGGMGKGVASKALATFLSPQKNEEDCFFEVGGNNVSFDNYDGQPTIIWNDMRAGVFIHQFGRGETFDIFDATPTSSVHNIKYGKIRLLNQFNIVNSVQPYKDFLDALSGAYYDKNGNFHDAEDKNQAYRRFPIIICLREKDFDILFNVGFFTKTRDYQQYIIYKNMVGNFSEIVKKYETYNNKASEKLLSLIIDKINKFIEDQSKSSTENSFDEDLFKIGFVDGKSSQEKINLF